MTSSNERIAELETEVRMLRGSLEPLAQADAVSSPTKMGAIAKVALKESRDRLTLTAEATTRSLIGGES